MLKLDKQYKPELVACDDEYRFAIIDPYFDSAEGKLVSTNGISLVAVPVASEGETSGYVSRQALVDGRKLAKKEKQAEVCVSGGAVNVLNNGARYPVSQERSFPPWRKVVPSYRPGSEGTVTVSLDVKALSRVVEALGSTDSRALLVIPAPESNGEVLDGIVVIPAGKAPEKFADYSDTAIGVLMPCRTLK